MSDFEIMQPSFELTCDNVKTLQVFNCSMSILLAISKVKTLKNLILDDALGRLDVSHILKLKGLRTLALHRHNMSRALLFQNVFVGIAKVTSHVTSLDLSEWFGSRYIGCEALKRTLVKFFTARSAVERHDRMEPKHLQVRCFL